MIEHPLNDGYILPPRGRDKIDIVDPGMVQLGIVSKNCNGFVVEALPQLWPLTVDPKLHHSDVDTRPFEIPRDIARRDAIIFFVRPMANVEFPPPPIPRCYAQSALHPTQKLRVIPSQVTFGRNIVWHQALAETVWIDRRRAS
jgi:hypothetical protein